MASRLNQVTRHLQLKARFKRPTSKVELNPQRIFFTSQPNQPSSTLKPLDPSYTTNQLKEVNLDHAGKLVKDLQDVQVPELRDQVKLSNENLKSTEDPDFKRKQFSIQITGFQNNTIIPGLMEDIGISRVTYQKHISDFCTNLASDKIEGATYYDCVAIYLAQGRFGIERHLLSHYLTYLIPHLSLEERTTFEFYRKMTDLSNPAATYPKARRMQRKIIMHVGPTNSGKTYRALKKLAESNRGVYCGPLRLLAYEVWKKFIDLGLPCDLVTGEERISAADYFSDPLKFASLESENKVKPEQRKVKPLETPFFHHQRLVSATTEMVSVNELYDVAVIDEIQLLGDQQRGWAWTRALLGVQAHEIHLCGEESAVPIVQEICRELNEEVVVKVYKRLSPLEVSSKSLRGYYGNIQAGDCLVTFSRKAIFRHKSSIERVTGLKCAVVYGRLPSEVRAQQARLFNDPDSPYKVMVASDAVGMGLNLNIRRIVFDALEKFDGKGMVKVPVPQVKQIAGRAGRFNTAFKDGVALCFHNDVGGYLNYAMSRPTRPLKKVGIQPDFDSLKLFSYQFPKDNMGQLLFKYSVLATVSSRYDICFGEEQMRIGALLAPLPLTLEDRMVFMMAPIKTQDIEVAAFTFKIAEAHSQDRAVLINDYLALPPCSLAKVDPAELETFEVAHKCVMLYFWLSQRLPNTMCDLTRAAELKATIEKRIDFMLPRIRMGSEGRKPAKPGTDISSTKGSKA